MIVEGTSLQSSWFKQDSFPQEPSAVLAMKKSSNVRKGAGKGHQLCTGCDMSIGSAAQVCFFHMIPIAFEAPSYLSFS
jgi:hypothetical protein